MIVTSRQRITAADEQAWNEAVLAEPVTRPHVAIWTYRAPAVVLGAGQHPDEAHRARARAAGVDLVRRRSGGGAVLVAPSLLGVSVALPADHPLAGSGMVAAYRWLGLAHAAALRALGVVAGLWRAPARGTRAPRPGGELEWACFGSLSTWEVAAAGARKIVGLAQVRRRTGVLLVAGTLLSDPDWSVLCAVFDAPPATARLLAERTASCARELGREVEAEEVAGLLEPRLRSALR